MLQSDSNVWQQHSHLVSFPSSQPFLLVLKTKIKKENCQEDPTTHSHYSPRRPCCNHLFLPLMPSREVSRNWMGRHQSFLRSCLSTNPLLSWWLWQYLLVGNSGLLVHCSHTYTLQCTLYTCTQRREGVNQDCLLVQGLIPILKCPPKKPGTKAKWQRRFGLK